MEEMKVSSLDLKLHFLTRVSSPQLMFLWGLRVSLVLVLLPLDSMSPQSFVLPWARGVLGVPGCLGFFLCSHLASTLFGHLHWHLGTQRTSVCGITGILLGHSR